MLNRHELVLSELVYDGALQKQSQLFAMFLYSRQWQNEGRRVIVIAKNPYCAPFFPTTFSI